MDPGMSQIINGLHIDVSSDELKTLLLGRLKYHQDKVGFYEKQLVEMKKVDAALTAEAQEMGKTSTRGPLESLEQAVKKHKDQTVYYKFMAEHVIANATYRLDEAALLRLGIQGERYF